MVRSLLHVARPDGLPHVSPVSIEAAMFSLFGWTPSLRRMLRGRVLPCGCSVGVYETRSGEVVQIVDARAAGCGLRAHSVDAIVPPGDALGDEPDAPGPVHDAMH